MSMCEKVLDLSRKYFNEVALPSLEREFPELLPRLAAGLVGNGSECFGYDDEHSRDHDWGIDFFLWVSEEDRERVGVLTAWKSRLMMEHPPQFARSRSEYGGRITIETAGDFYKSIIGISDCPATLNEWVNVPEASLALVTNGEVFLDNHGRFTRIRKALLQYFPEDLRLKRLAYNCMITAQTGQYNFSRSMLRGDIATARATLALWHDAVTALVFLLNCSYRPYYKWRQRRLTELPVLGMEIAEKLDIVAAQPLPDGKAVIDDMISDVCKAIARELRREGLALTNDWFFTAHGEEIRAKITHDKLRQLPAQYEI